MNKFLKILRLAGKNPSMAAAKAAITWRNQVSVKRDYRREDGSAGRLPRCASADQQLQPGV
jgi:hypothetical protein